MDKDLNRGYVEPFRKHSCNLMANKFIEESKEHLLCVAGYAPVRKMYDAWSKKVLVDNKDGVTLREDVWAVVVLLVDTIVPQNLAMMFLCDYKVVFASDHPSFEWAFEDWCRFIKVGEMLRPKVWKKVMETLKTRAKKARKNGC